MKKVVTRERNKAYYRVLHVPIWIWVFFVLPGHLTYSLFAHGPDVRHGIWLAIVTAVCAWRGYAGRLPDAEEAPYITYYGVDQPNLWYRVVCYTAAWIALMVPFLLNVSGMVVAAFTGEWKLILLFQWFYYPLAGLFVVATALDLIPRAKRSTQYEGAERAWFYVWIWTVVPSQVVAWAAWRLMKTTTSLDPVDLARVRLSILAFVVAVLLTLGARGILPRTGRYYAQGEAT